MPTQASIGRGTASSLHSNQGNDRKLDGRYRSTVGQSGERGGLSVGVHMTLCGATISSTSNLNRLNKGSKCAANSSIACAIGRVGFRRLIASFFPSLSLCPTYQTRGKCCRCICLCISLEGVHHDYRFHLIPIGDTSPQAVTTLHLQEVWCVEHAVQRNGKWESRTEARAFGSCHRMGVESAYYAVVVASSCSIRER
jgi:hypothetical protein